MSTAQLFPSKLNTVLRLISSPVAAVVHFAGQPVSTLECLDRRMCRGLALLQGTCPVPFPKRQIRSPLNHIYKMRQ